jgi:type II secretory pathway pseudopilin PulG
MNKGFTLVEMLIYIVTLVLVVGTVTTILVWMVRANNQVHIKNEVVENVEHALALMTNEIREAQSVYTSTMTTPSQLSLETAKNPPAGETSTYVDFFLCGTRLCVKRESQAPQAITSEKIEIQSVEFTQVQTGFTSSIHMAIEASYLTASSTMQATASIRTY